MATAQAAVEVARLTKTSTHAKEHYAVVVIQISFRGYLVSVHNRSKFFNLNEKQGFKSGLHNHSQI